MILYTGFVESGGADLDSGLQHACHERVRLEALEKEVYGEASDARKARTLFVPLRIRLPDKAEEVAALQHPNVRNALGRWGFQYQVDVAAKSVRDQRSWMISEIQRGVDASSCSRVHQRLPDAPRWW